MNRLTGGISLLVLIFLLGFAFGEADEETYYRIWGQNWYRNHKGFIVYGYYSFFEKFKPHQVASTICAETGSDYKIKSGAKAYLFQIWCGSSHCSCDDDLKSSYTTSTLKSNGAIITWNGDGVDLSHANRGVHFANGGYSVNAYYQFTAKEFAKANFIGKKIPYYYVCFEKLSDSIKDVGLD